MFRLFLHDSLDDRAKIISYEEYTPYGISSYQAVRSQTEAPKRYRYTGKERDEESGFNYHGARYYAPWLSRWTSADPAGMVDGSNLYRYVRNNPIKLVDTLGTNSDDFDLSNIVAGAIRRVRFALDIDEVDAVKGDRAGGVAGSPSAPENKQLLDSRTNRQTKKNFVSDTPSNPRPNVSIASSPGEAADRILTGRLSEVDELREIAEDAAENTTPGRRTNAGVRRRIRRNNAVRGALESRGINPDTLTLENPSGVQQFPTSESVNLSPVDADIDPETGQVVDGPNTRAAQARRAAQSATPATQTARASRTRRAVQAVGGVVRGGVQVLSEVGRVVGPLGTVEAGARLATATNNSDRLQAGADLAFDAAGYFGPVGGALSGGYAVGQLLDQGVEAATGESLSSRGASGLESLDQAVSSILPEDESLPEYKQENRIAWWLIDTFNL